MNWSYEFTPHVWFILASAAILAAMVIYGFRYRSVPGCLPLIILAAVIILWFLANGLELASTNAASKIFWHKVQAALLLLLVNISLGFVFEYAGLSKSLTPRMLVSLTILPLVFALLISTNEIHHLVWTRIWFDGDVRYNPGPVHSGAMAYSYLLSLIHLMVLAWLFGRSPRHRWITSGLILAALSLLGASILKFRNWNPVAPVDPMVFALNFAMVPYALAIFRFRMFEVVPVARNMILEQMTDGILVLDVQNRIADVNERAQTLLGIVKSKVLGGRVVEVLQAYPDLLDLVHHSGNTQREVSFGSHARWYQVSISPLNDRRGFQLGRLISLRDISEQKQTHAQLLDHQRTLAMLRERELLARELHDGIGQLLAGAHFQVESAKQLLARGDTVSVESCLHRLGEVTQEAKEAVRDYLLGVKTRSSVDRGLLKVLHQYLNQYSHNYGIHTELVVAPELEGKRIDSAVEVQLQPIIQEALTNVRKHAGVCSARVIFAVCNGQIQIMVEDDGRGFDPTEEITENRGFGLRSMRGRADMVGADLEVNSTPGKGTQVVIKVPWQKEAE